eukprot:CAMPEP_0197829742 /NCGR_PEP_ID=MMETSP1437-20131217/6291_1 /TAXON_ID=49252 ORGANISM="Eucampia antarctica, Strain CCMP1452" /NCGR_SAMPLE_ID=MMETSP1437 /ASSEMBLY_ACC=CAM_ASM_001096 /LENGTH=47 /DNA_ID= /DNA_START= /DNA_END= /DNA_ORIENTATION=
MIGYVIRETKVKFTVRFSGGQDIVMRKPRFEDGGYICDDSTNNEMDA